jgi:hypothetical protein
MQPKFLVLEVQKITNFLELTFFLDLAGCALGLGLDREHTTRVQLQTSLGSNFVKPEA